MKTIKLSVPASTSNLGPGFDTLGMALQWPLELTASQEGDNKIQIEEDLGAESQVPDNYREVVLEAIGAWEQKAGKTALPVKLSFASDIPLARGLGSSACCRLATITAVNILEGGPLDPNELLELTCILEGHTDNAVASQLGGLTISGWDRGRVRMVRYSMPESIRLVALVPDNMLSTEEARRVLPPEVPLQHAVENMQRVLWLVHALTKNLPGLLNRTFQDNIHQPYRKKLLPFLGPVIEAAEKAGAYGAFLSGSGSAVLAISQVSASEDTAGAMIEKLRSETGSGYVKILKPDNRGCTSL